MMIQGEVWNENYLQVANMMASQKLEEKQGSLEVRSQ